ncbi:MAG TPA: hypothetical protein VFO70_12495, partial [Chitinophagaceae bacterium]|nr:hypothetical protein [Chitinophagaceae bacterium]
MEVHHHSRPTNHGGQGKKWKHYFWEFLMLFLAVFSGFLAEYQLEHTIEHQREKKFAKRLLADLRADSVFFAKRIRDMNGKIEEHQRFFELMNGPVKPTDREILSACVPL